MSVDYYMACSTCKKAIHAAQVGLGGFTFYRTEHSSAALGAFLEAHFLCSPPVQFVNEHVVDDGYALLNWLGVPVPDIPGDDVDLYEQPPK